MHAVSHSYLRLGRQSQPGAEGLKYPVIGRAELEVHLLEWTAQPLFCAVQAQQAGTGYVPDPELVLNHEELWTGVFAIAAMRFGWVVHVGPPPSW